MQVHNQKSFKKKDLFNDVIFIKIEKNYRCFIYFMDRYTGRNIGKALSEAGTI